MAIGVYFPPGSLTARKYDETIKLLRKAGAGHPPGRLYHSAFGPKTKLMVYDVWTSRAAFDRFGKKLKPIMKQLGVGGKPQFMPVHNTIVPRRKKR